MQKYAIIVAGGKGLRMGSSLPKQFLLLNGLPVLMHTINAFFLADKSTEIYVVLPEDHLSYWKELVDQYLFDIDHQLVTGGESRFQSVKNGLSAIGSSGVVAIHDGVRPLVSASIINNSFEQANKYGSAIAAVPCKDSLRVKSGDTTKSVDRSAYYLIQTPQTFRVPEIKDAFQVEEQNYFTDDASVFENAGRRIVLIDGDYRNIKLTTKEDIIFANAMISR